MSGCEYGYDDGVYVLGALAPADRAEYERHLRDCASCRRSVAEVAALPGLLNRLDPAALPRLPTPPATEAERPRLADLIAKATAARRRERRMRWWRYLAVGLAAAGLALLVAIGGLRLAPWATPGGPTGDPSAPMVAMHQVRAGVPVSAQIGLRDTASGTEITMRCVYRSTNHYARRYDFQLLAYGRDGASQQLGSWTAGPGDELQLSTMSPFASGELVRLVLTDATGKPLLSYDIP